VTVALRRAGLAAVAAVLLAGGCAEGGGDGDQTIELRALDHHYEDVPEEVEAGTVTLRMANEGVAAHDLLIEELDDERVIDVVAPGDEGEGTVDLEPGTYTLYCSIPGHREAGMEHELEVVE